MAAASTPSASSLLDELDFAIAEHLRLAGQEIESEDSSIAALHQLRDMLVSIGDQPLDDISLRVIRTAAPLPAWLPTRITSALKITCRVSGSQALEDS